MLSREMNRKMPGPGSRISIRDYGRGISADVQRRIFDPYFTTKPGGAGLGLATAYAIVLKHGGHIAVESAPGAGSVFTVDLPASLETPLAETSTAAPPQTGTERLLVMDDEETAPHSVPGCSQPARVRGSDGT